MTDFPSNEELANPNVAKEVVLKPYLEEVAEKAVPFIPKPKPPVKQEPVNTQGLPPSVLVEKASTPMRLERPDPKATGPWVAYRGVATVRVFTAADWARVGIDSTKRYEWNALNHKKLPKSIFSKEQLDYLLNIDRRFVLVED